MPTQIVGATGIDKVQDGTIVNADIDTVAASKLTGTIADARFPATLPVASGANLTALPAANITGTLPAISGANLTNLPSGGKVLQVVSATDGGYTTSSSSTYADTGLTATITPSATSSKVLVLISHGTCEKRNSDTGMALQLLRGSTAILKFAGQIGYHGASVSTSAVQSSNASTTYLDSPATTSATVYKTQFKSNNNASLVGLHPDGDLSTIQLLEISE